tara:strand:- start:775 stop:1512 length:738 start_codon:yes stop_codon:yes gene_type:complete
MLNNTTLQLKFRQRLNKIASNDYDNIECWQIVEAFNKAQIEWCRRQLHGNNLFKEGDEMSKRRIDDLQILLTNIQLPTVEFENFIESQAINFPENFFEFKRVTVEAYTECCPAYEDKGVLRGRSMTVYLAEEANVDLYLRDPLKKPDFDWGETFVTMQGDRVRIYKTPEFSLTNPIMTYYRRPRLIEIAGCVDPYTLVQSTNDVQCEFKDDVAELIIDEAVAIVAGDIQDTNNYIRGSQSAEKNN